MWGKWLVSTQFMAPLPIYPPDLNHWNNNGSVGNSEAEQLPP